MFTRYFLLDCCSFLHVPIHPRWDLQTKTKSCSTQSHINCCKVLNVPTALSVKWWRWWRVLLSANVVDFFIWNRGYCATSHREMCEKRKESASKLIKQYCEIFSIYTYIKHPFVPSVLLTLHYVLSYHPVGYLHLHNSHTPTQTQPPGYKYNGSYLMSHCVVTECCLTVLRVVCWRIMYSAVNLSNLFL